jgi:hypothetical protein
VKKWVTPSVSEILMKTSVVRPAFLFVLALEAAVGALGALEDIAVDPATST